jgi:O-antigen/teichoic acid export membrane protein
VLRFGHGRVLADWSENWAFAKWALLSFSIVDTIPFVMPWIVTLSGGPAASGTFGACTTLIGVTNVFIGGTGNFLKPKAAESFLAGGTAGLSRVLMGTAWVFTAVFGSLCLLVLATGDRLAVLVFGDAYSGTGAILLSLAGGVLIGSLGWIAANGLWAIGQLRASFIADTCMLLATLLATACLVGPYGPLGAALATLVGMFVGASLKIATLYRALRSLRRSGESSHGDRRQAASFIARSDQPAMALHVDS